MESVSTSMSMTLYFVGGLVAMNLLFCTAIWFHSQRALHRKMSALDHGIQQIFDQKVGGKFTMNPIHESDSRSIALSSFGTKMSSDDTSSILRSLFAPKGFLRRVPFPKFQPLWTGSETVDHRDDAATVHDAVPPHDHGRGHIVDAQSASVFLTPDGVKQNGPNRHRRGMRPVSERDPVPGSFAVGLWLRFDFGPF